MALTCVVALVSSALAGCGGGSGGGDLPDPGPDAGIDPTTPLSTLTPAQQEELCQWVAGRFHGYGRRITCTDGDYLTSQSSCSASPEASTFSADCEDTIGDIEDCINSAVGGCPALPDECISLLVDCGMPM
jgi:hypothetical protein